MFDHLVAYKKAHGHCNVPGRDKKYPRLSVWVNFQRQCFRLHYKSSLTREKVARLDSLGFDWNPLANRWDQRYRELIAFKTKYGHCQVSNSYPGKILKKWVMTQRERYREGFITLEQVQQLEAIGFKWNWINDRRINGVWVKARWADNPPLASLKRKFADRIHYGEPAVFPEESSRAARWSAMFSLLKEYIQINGHSNVPHRYAENAFLGSWVSRNRHVFKENKLLPERKQRLESIGFQ